MTRLDHMIRPRRRPAAIPTATSVSSKPPLSSNDPPDGPNIDDPEDPAHGEPPRRHRRLGAFDAFDGDPYREEPSEDDDDVAPDRDAAAIDALTRAMRPGHSVMNRAEISMALRASGYDGGGFDQLSAGEEQRVRVLLQYRDAGLFKPHLIGAPAMLDRLDALGRAQPNFQAVTRFVRRAVHLSQVSGRAINVPGVVLHGSPGIGKTRYAKALVECLGTELHVINGSSIPDVSSITGHPPVWRGAGPGYVAKYLMSSKTSGPVVLIDEACKVYDFEAMNNPLDRLLTLLEPGTASTYKDEFLQVDMQAQYATFLFACNSLDWLSAPLADRLVAFTVPDLTRDQRDTVLEAMLGEVAATIGLPVSLAGREALAPVRELGLRRCRLAFEVAIDRAVEQQRRFVTAEDLAEAWRCSPGPTGMSLPASSGSPAKRGRG